MKSSSSRSNCWASKGVEALLSTALLSTALLSTASPATATDPDPFIAARERMVREVLVEGGIRDPRVIESMRTTRRHEFVPPQQRRLAYVDMALPIGESQTISGIFVVAYMTEQLQPRATDRVLEIGTGSGYQAAVLAPLVKTVYSIEIHEPLGRRAAATLRRLGYENVVTTIGDGFRGWPEHAPFDKIIVTCSPEDVPEPLVEQLAEGGRMVIPVGERYDQTLVLLTKRGGRMVREPLVPSLFVPMTGRAEGEREVQPDGTRPSLNNGGFEEPLGDPTVPAAWYYGRQMQRFEAADAAEGRWVARLVNRDLGRPAHLFQGFPVDGRKVRRLTVSLAIRGEGILAGRGPQTPSVVVRFYNATRARSSRDSFGGWVGSYGWRRVHGEIAVPPWAREAIIQVGLLGATGSWEVDDVAIRSEPR